MIPWRRTPAAKGSSELTMASYWQGGSGFRANMTVEGRRNFGAPDCNIKLAVGRLLEKPEIHMKKTEKAAIMVTLANPRLGVLKRPASSSLPALSQQQPLHKWDRHKFSPPETVTVGTPAQIGKIRHVVREKDGRVRMTLSRKGFKREFSNWHESKEKAFHCILNKISQPKKQGSEAACNLPARSQYAVDVPGVAIVHQIYGLYRDGKDMSPLFLLSSKSWQLYCIRQQSRYMLWTADAIDTLIQNYAPHNIATLYKEVRFLVQRVDIARFFLLYIYGGLYVDLDVLPNREVYPQVTLGLCKMPSRAVSQPPEYEMEMVIATRGNCSLLKLLDYMSSATNEKKPMKYYGNKPCRYIYPTIGPHCVERFFRSSVVQQSIIVYV